MVDNDIQQTQIGESSYQGSTTIASKQLCPSAHRCIRGAFQRGTGVYLKNNSLVRIVRPGNSTWIERHGRSTTLLESLAGLQFNSTAEPSTQSSVTMLEPATHLGKDTVGVHGQS